MMWKLFALALALGAGWTLGCYIATAAVTVLRNTFTKGRR